MTPDQAHEQYMQQTNNKGNHDKPSRETLKLMGELERRMNSELDTKIGKSAFWTLFATMMTVVSGMFGLVWNEVKTSNDLINAKIDAIESSTTETSKTVAKIEGKLQPFEFMIE